MSFGAKTIVWTYHSRAKMRQYGLSEQRVLRILHTPKRVEEGVAPQTLAVMQPVFVESSKIQNPNIKPADTWKQELWVMVQDIGKKRKIISAWRYPGVTKPRSEVTKAIFSGQYLEYLAAAEKEEERKAGQKPKITLPKRWQNAPKRPWPKRPFGKNSVSSAVQI